MNARWKQAVLPLPAMSLALLPKLACPACWPAYAGLLATLGLGFLISQAYLLPLTAVFLAVALGAMALRAPERRGYRPLALGAAAAIGILAGKFLWESELVLYASLAVFVLASFWNVWPRGAALAGLRAGDGKRDAAAALLGSREEGAG